MALWRPNFSWVTGDLAIGGSYLPEEAGSLADVHGFGAVVDLRSEACDDCETLARLGITFMHLPTEDLQAVSRDDLDQGVVFARRCADGGVKLLIHCEHGIGRSALLALCVLVDRGMAPIEALRTLKDAREKVSPSPPQFQAWAQWLDQRRHAPVDFEAFCSIAYRSLARA
jgi:hypothetical protein